jgi:hypothetical protein
VCTFTQAEAAAGISVPYQFTIETDLTGVVPIAQDFGDCDLPGPSGLIRFERLEGDDQLYCECDSGLCMPPTGTPTDLTAGTWDHTFEWSGLNWSGWSDTGNEPGDAFPPGSYTLTVSAKGTVDGVDFEVLATWPITITE